MAASDIDTISNDIDTISFSLNFVMTMKYMDIQQVTYWFKIISIRDTIKKYFNCIPGFTKHCREIMTS